MKIIKQSWEFLSGGSALEMMRLIETAGRTCYKSEDKIDNTSAAQFVRRIIASGHHSVIEHVNITVKIITDRGVTHEIVRHRLASYSQESTRYCNYSKDSFGNEITVILPVWFFNPNTEDNIANDKRTEYAAWYNAMRSSEAHYFNLLKLDQTPQQARSVLPNSLKTEIVMTCNIREWRHFFTLRCSKAAHPQMRELALSMLAGFKEAIPVLFEDVYPTEEKAA